MTLASPSPQSGTPYGNFGLSVAASSGGTVVVGAPYENVSGLYSAGVAYLFDTATGALTVTLTSPNPRNGGGFGTSVAISGDTVVIGAPLENSTYIFDASTGALADTLSSPDALNSGGFGTSVAVSGDTVVVGAPLDNSAYVFDAATGNLTETLTSPNPRTGAVPGEFGLSVAVSGDTVAVGAPYEVVGASQTYPYGRAYVFDAATGALTANLTSPSPQDDGRFGSSVALSGSTLVVGAEGEDDAFVFNATTGTLVQNITSTDPSFGSSVAASGGVVVVGAPFAPMGGNYSAGRAYVFEAMTGTLTENVTSPNAQGGGFFGDSVALSGTVLVVGAYGESVGGASMAGRAYVLSIPNTAMSSTTTAGTSGVPEFPALPLAAMTLSAAIVAAYVAARRRGGTAPSSLTPRS